MGLRKLVLIIAAVIAGGMCLGQQTSGTSPVAQAPAPGTSFAYEVVAIKPNTSGSGSVSINTNNDSYTAENVGLKVIIEQAYGLQIPEQVTGLPGWADGAHFDIKAKMDSDTAARLKVLAPKERANAENAMMQQLLAERFGLNLHHEMRDLPEYALVQAKGGSKLKLADATNPKAGGMSVRNGKMEAFSVELPQLLYFLSFRVHRAVVDRTGLTGKFDLALEWTPEEMANSQADGATEKAPGLFTALQEQMGLKLESIKGPVDTVVVDHIQQPTEN